MNTVVDGVRGPPGLATDKQAQMALAIARVGPPNLVSDLLNPNSTRIILVAPVKVEIYYLSI